MCFSYKKVLFGIITIIFGFQSTSSAEIVDRVIAKINKEIITLSEMKERAFTISLESKMRRGNNNSLKKSLEADMLNLMIDELLQLQHARKLSLDIPDEYVYNAINDIKKKNSLTDESLESLLKKEHLTTSGYRKKIREQMMISKVINFEVKSRILLGEDEIKKYYKEKQYDYITSEQVNIKNILLIVNADATESKISKIRKKGLSILEKIKTGANFDEMAKKYSEGPNAISGGESGFFKRGTMAPEFEDISFSMKKGEISDLIKTSFGFHIIKVIEKKEAKPKNFEEVKSIIEKKLYEIKTQKKYTQWIKELRENSYIDILLTHNNHSVKSQPQITN